MKEKKNRSMFSLEQEFVELLHEARGGFDPETGEATDEELLDHVDARISELHGEVEHKLTGVGHVITRLKGERSVIDEEIARLQARKKQYDRGIARLEDRASAAMIAVGKDKVENPFITLTLRKPTKKVQIDDFDALPSQYVVYPPPPDPRPDKRSIGKALKEGEEVPGARHVDGKRSLQIR